MSTILESIFTDQTLEGLLKIENLLNESSGNRYHFESGNDWKFLIKQIFKNGDNKILIEDLSLEQMYRWLKRHLKVTLIE